MAYKDMYKLLTSCIVNQIKIFSIQPLIAFIKNNQ